MYSLLFEYILRTKSESGQIFLATNTRRTFEPLKFPIIANHLMSELMFLWGPSTTEAWSDRSPARMLARSLAPGPARSPSTGPVRAVRRARQAGYVARTLAHLCLWIHGSMEAAATLHFVNRRSVRSFPSRRTPRARSLPRSQALTFRQRLTGFLDDNRDIFPN